MIEKLGSFYPAKLMNAGLFLILGNAVLALFPEDPFRSYIRAVQMPSEFSQYLRAASFFVPIGAMLAVLEVWLLLITGMYVLLVIMRLTKIYT